MNVTSATLQPELIISLSHDKVNVHLLALPHKRLTAWKTSFPITGDFVSDQISMALDRALTENPDLVDNFPCVYLLVMDRPNLQMPSYLEENGKLAEVASRHLRVRMGDRLTTDPTSENSLICYSLPRETLNVLREYYRSIDSIHIVSLLWKAIQGDSQDLSSGKPRMFATLLGNMFFVLATRESKLIFSKLFIIREQTDVEFYSIACNRLLKPEKIYWITVRDEFSSFAEPKDHYVRFDEHLSFPSLADLLAKYKPCE
jgi:hypothetical protein